jgi:hypothetical protein
VDLSGARMAGVGLSSNLARNAPSADDNTSMEPPPIKSKDLASQPWRVTLGASS